MNYITKDIYNNYLKLALTIPGFKKGTKGQYNDITELANKYCDADENTNELEKSKYYSALIIRYWYMINYMKNTCKSCNLREEDFVSWLEESLNIAFKYRRWRDPNNKLYNNPKGPELVINMAIYSTQKRYYNEFNKDKRRANKYSYSMEESIDIHGDSAECLQIQDNFEEVIYINDLIQQLINNNKIFEALIVHNICMNNSFVTKIQFLKTNNIDMNGHPVIYKQDKSYFSLTKLVNCMSNLDNNYILNFSNNYNIQQPILNNEIQNIKNISHIVLLKKVKHSLNKLKKSKEILEYVKLN